ncbi:adenosine deaminase-like [Mya arenaria]|uniref:adenosine deaminase-like n=1 Tax=Mya arenaria TaxID=6604 RepID=UPI0022E3371A|nr:adenosine deaminase-like [Mya arenaria]
MENTRQRVCPVKDDFPYKVELHVHLDGTFRLESILDIAKKRNIPLPAADLDGFRKNISVYHALSLYKVLKSFTVFMPVVAGDRDAISKLAYEFCEDSAKNGIKYVEARYSPHLLSNNEEKPEYALEHGDLTPREIVKIINEAFAKGSKDYNIRVKSILCCMRHRPDWSDELVNLAHEYRQEGVVAVDIAGGSNHHDDVEEVHPDHIKAFKRAKDLGLHITVHAGEAGGADRVKQAIDEMNAERIGHGYRVLENEDLYAEIRRRGIHLETCPISSICTGAVPEDVHKHPVVRFAHDKANFSINSDDPLVFDSCLFDDYKATREMGLDDSYIRIAIFNAARSCFSSDKEKADILKELEDVYGKQ